MSKMSKGRCGVFKARTQVGTILDFTQLGRNTRGMFSARVRQSRQWVLHEGQQKWEIKAENESPVSGSGRREDVVPQRVPEEHRRRDQGKGMVMRSLYACRVGGCLVDTADSWISEERDLSYG